MNFLHLLHARDVLLRQAHLANLAYAYERLGVFAGRIRRARLQGPVRFELADPDADRPWPVLTALAGSQAVLEEHFSDEDLAELADVLAFLREDAHTREFSFELQDFAACFLTPVRRELLRAGVAPEGGAEVSSPEDSTRNPG